MSVSVCRTYVEGLRPQDPDQSGAESLLLFGPAAEISPWLAPLLAAYRKPPFASGDVACSFGIGASGAGVPWHVHGHGFAEVIHGAKASYNRDIPRVDNCVWLRCSNVKY